jgi:hypothetical protein
MVTGEFFDSTFRAFLNRQTFSLYASRTKLLNSSCAESIYDDMEAPDC